MLHQYTQLSQKKDKMTVTTPTNGQEPRYVPETPSGDTKVVNPTLERPGTALVHQEEDESFSACLLVMDENHRLPEWIAYHYFMLPLRHLIILVDPRSRTRPDPIMERWRPFLSTLQVWSDDDIQYTPMNSSSQEVRTLVHRKRQSTFYQHCARSFRQQNRSWVSFHDVDEYVYLDPVSVPHARDRMTKPGSVLSFLKEMRATTNKTTNETTSKNLLQYTKDAFQKRCIIVSRTYFGAVESSHVQGTVPSYLNLNVTSFETLRWLHRTSHEDASNNGIGKSLLYVGKPSPSLNFEVGWDKGVHRVLQECPVTNHKYSPIRIRHYLGSWEVFTSRVDVRSGDRRSKEFYEYTSQLGAGTDPDTDIQPWLTDFCKFMGHNASLLETLLQGVGQLPPRSLELQTADWSMPPNRIRKMMEKQYKNVPPFVVWLRQNFVVTTLTNGTTVVEPKVKPNQRSPSQAKWIKHPLPKGLLQALS